MAVRGDDMNNPSRRAPEQPAHFIGVDRRRAERYYVSVPIEFQGGRGTTRDVSEFGVRFETDGWFRPGALIRFLLLFNDIAGYPSWRIAGAGEVLRVEEYGSRSVVAVRVTTYGLG